MILIVAGILTPLENVMKSILDFFHGSVGLSWPWSIVALTVLVRIMLVPLAVRQIHSMQSMQRHAPEMKAIQQKYKGDRQKLNEELMKFYRENHINPAASCLPLVLQFPIFIALYFTLRHESHNITGAWLHVVPNISDKTTAHWSGYILLAIYAGSQVASTYFMGATMDKTQRHDHDGPPARVPDRRRPVSDGPRPVLDDHEPMDGRAGPDHAAAGPTTPPPRRGPREHITAPKLANASETRTPSPNPSPSRHPCACADDAAPRPAEEEGRRTSVSEELSVEASGETVGEAKWKALRDLERLAPGLDRGSVRFQVVSEGERGLLGVGFTPALVVASTDGAGESPSTGPRPGESDAAAHIRGLVERVVAALGVKARVEVDESDDELLVTCTGGELGLLIGKHGHTIDSLQYLANVITHRAGGEKRVTVDAAGYRDRRRSTLEAIAVRSAERARARRASRSRSDVGSRAEDRARTAGRVAGGAHLE